MSSVEEPVHSPRKRVNANRSRILDAAMRCFAGDPDASMDDVAKAAGVVRRTVYAHFPNRDALVEGLADEAGAALAASVEFPEPEDAAVALAAGVLRLGPVSDRYRVLLSFARKEVGEERISELIAPVRTHTYGVVERGRAAGVFSAYLPTVVLVGMMEGLTIATLEQANRGVVDDASGAMALGVLVLAGVAPARASEVVGSARRWLQATA
ncbi:MAG TPA: TetR/AcrR family transcriptional regulator [Rhodococcus sp. (in: high G+C Gram-positive bacteria)]|nr:TetR/AcrR family transcriptional regulator [Rhodococcus sp. (in: high G+C Gram-positive bacteria)]